VTCVGITDDWGIALKFVY